MLPDSLYKKVMTISAKDYSPSNFQIRNIRWTRERATEEALDSHIGIMPIDDSKMSKGKGGFKLIQYLSVALPVAGSAVGINNSIVTEDVGKKISGLESEQWRDGLLDLAADKEQWCRMSENAMARWHKCYDYTYNFEFWDHLVHA